jgi:hypothetical protein
MINPNVSAGVTGDKSPGGRHAGTPPMHLPRPAAIFGPARQPRGVNPRCAATAFESLSRPGSLPIRALASSKRILKLSRISTNFASRD